MRPVEAVLPGVGPGSGCAVTADQARRIAAEHFGLTAHAESLGSRQDANFLLTYDDGSPAAVLKIANQAFTTTEIDAQDTAADLIADAQPGLRPATVLRDADGNRRAAAVDTDSGPVTARLLRHVPGGTLSGPRHLPPRTVAAMGRIAGQVSTTLSGFRHPGLDRVLQWDPRHAERVVGQLLEHVTEADRRTAVWSAATEAWAALLEVADRLPRQAVHLDLTDDNLVRSPDNPLPLPDGIIDFGDLTDTWAVCELAIPLSSMLHHDGMEPHHVLPAVRAFHETRPLSAPGHLAVTCGPYALQLSFPDAVRPAPTADAPVRAGDPLAALPAGTRFHVSLQEQAVSAVPPLVRPEYAPGWLALTADPAPLLGLPTSATAPQPDLLARREAAFAPVQEHYYANPPRMERGWRHHMISAEGRSYLDMVNNVTPLGHAHPRSSPRCASTPPPSTSSPAPSTGPCPNSGTEEPNDRPRPPGPSPVGGIIR
ncbi:phosphotransferase [Streptomyces sp. NPDC101160]|uniref:phosphotransferase n=1 Tax=Streptomyces sp. NPDC101160 TaxID=3366118 RepID=UPI003820D055